MKPSYKKNAEIKKKKDTYCHGERNYFNTLRIYFRKVYLLAALLNFLLDKKLEHLNTYQKYLTMGRVKLETRLNEAVLVITKVVLWVVCKQFFF